MAGIGFNSIPGQGLTAPLFAFELNSGGSFDSASRLVLAGHKTSAGTLGDAVPSIASTQAEADALAGPGSMLREMYRVARRNAEVQEIWIVPVAASGVADVRTITIASLPAAGGVGVFDVCGERIQIAIGAGDTVTSGATAVKDAINAYYNRLTDAMLPVTATSALGVVTVTARHAGVLGTEVDIFVPTDVAGNVFAGAGVFTVATTTPGTGVPSLAAALAALGDDPADMVISPWADTASLDAYQTTMSDSAGRWSYLRQVYGHVVCCNTGNTAAQTTLGGGRNDRHATIIPRPAGVQQPSWLWAAGFGARPLSWLSDITTGNVSRNQTGLVVEGIDPPRDKTLIWNYAARNSFNNTGISSWNVIGGRVAIDKLVTTYRLGVSGQPDTVFRNINRLFQASGGLKYIRAILANEHGQKALADANPGNLAAISTPADVKATFIHSYDDLVNQGVFENVAEFARRCVVKRNALNSDRCDVFAPLDAVNQFDVLAANATIYNQYRVAA